MLLFGLFCVLLLRPGAANKNRSYGGFLVLSLFLSPLIGAFILLVLGKAESEPISVVTKTTLYENEGTGNNPYGLTSTTTTYPT